MPPGADGGGRMNTRSESDQRMGWRMDTPRRAAAARRSGLDTPARAGRDLVKSWSAGRLRFGPQGRDPTRILTRISQDHHDRCETLRSCGTPERRSLAALQGQRQYSPAFLRAIR